MTIEEVLKHFGGKSATAEALDVSYQAVQQWEDNNAVPETRQFQIQVLTGGKLKAEKKAKKILRSKQKKRVA